MAKPIRILLQTTIPTTEDDWSIFRFSMLKDYLASIQDEAGNSLFEVIGHWSSISPLRYLVFSVSPHIWV
ncbi:MULTISPECIES: hypothetical protein [unclassified Nostoc]|uniref:hypothetical protein n=1 Tax=unclassified Nostoc TaxID=2593658 RepID=UPI0025AB1694|nr:MULTISPECIES: hypothetical protein [unclassified Nostoc]MDM9585418.1 hypothetical protein [Nostoc sp. GT001]MDZ7949191.1 hypothetical protein [Nostoc sp. EfeVER01]MDZ7994559.1 hypothetical protein [Nostoc sp. EspVER01]